MADALAARVKDMTNHGGWVVTGFPRVLIEGKPAARVTDMHICPAATVVPPPVTIPHVGGPILPPGEPSVLIGGLPAARVGDWALCVGAIDAIAHGAVKTYIGKKMPPPPPGPIVVQPWGPGGPGTEPVAVNHIAVLNVQGAINVLYVWSGGAVVAVGGAALGVLAAAIAVVVAPFYTKVYGGVRDLPSCGCCAPEPVSSMGPHGEFFSEGVRDDAEVYFL